MVRNHGGVSLAYLRGERRYKKKIGARIRITDLTPEQEDKAAEEARITGDTFQECVTRILCNQKKLEEFKNG